MVQIGNYHIGKAGTYKTVLKDQLTNYTACLYITTHF